MAPALTPQPGNDGCHAPKVFRICSRGGLKTLCCDDLALLETTAPPHAPHTPGSTSMPLCYNGACWTGWLLVILPYSIFHVWPFLLCPNLALSSLLSSLSDLQTHAKQKGVYCHWHWCWRWQVFGEELQLGIMSKKQTSTHNSNKKTANSSLGTRWSQAKEI